MERLLYNADYPQLYSLSVVFYQLETISKFLTGIYYFQFCLIY